MAAKGACGTSSFAPATPPQAVRKPTQRQFHGRLVEDDYAWLAAENWREALRDPSALPRDIASLLEAENAHCAEALAPAKTLRETLIAEMRARIKEDDAGPPTPDGPYSYYQRYRQGGEHPLYCRRPREGGEEEILLDGEALAKGRKFFEIGDAAHTRDHAALAWSLDDKGSELYAIRTRALSDGRDRRDIVRDTDGSIVWSRDGSSFLYVRVDEDHRTDAVLLHKIGSSQRQDRILIEERDPAWFVSLAESRCGRFAVVTIHGHDASEGYLIDLADTDAAPRRVAGRENGLRYEVEPHGERLFILANADGAEDFAIFSAPLSSVSRADWRTVVAHRKGRMLVAMTVYARHLVWIERENALPRLVIREIDSGAEHAIDFTEEAYSLSLEPGLEFETTTLRFVYSSPTTPDETYDYDMTARERVLVKRLEIPSGHDPKNYVARRIAAKALDGESVPITLLYRKGFEPGEGAPLLLYGYGAYGDSLDAEFDSDVLSLVDRGFVYALAHVRGGTERGWSWYENGKLEHKTNSFSDYIACARKLIEFGFYPRRLDRRAGRLGRRHADGRHHEYGAAALRRRHRRGALRRCAEHDAACRSAADPSGMARMGQSDRGPRGLRAACGLLAIRQCQGATLSADPGARRPDRPARDLLGALEVGAAPARHDDGGRTRPAQNSNGRRTRRRLGAFRVFGRDRAGMGLRADVRRFEREVGVEPALRFVGEGEDRAYPTPALPSIFASASG